MIASIVLVDFGLALAARGPWLVGRVLHAESAPMLGWWHGSPLIVLGVMLEIRQQCRAELLMSDTFTSVDRPPF